MSVETTGNARRHAPLGALRPSTVALSMVVAFALVMLGFTLQGFMLLDDYELQSLAFAASWLDPAFLTQPWGGHFMPAGFALAQLIAKTTPFTYLPISLLITAGMGAFAYASARLFLYVLGDRWRALVPLGLVLVSGATWDSATWWIAALNAVPLFIAIPTATLLQLRWLRGGSTREALLAWGTVVIAALFFEKALGLIVFLGLVTLALRGQGRGVRNRRTVVLLIALYSVTLIAFASAYLMSTTGTVARLPDPSTLADFLRIGLLTFPALALGGPWQWAPPALAATPLVISVFCLNLVVALGIYQSVRSKRAAILWLGLLAYLVALIGIVASGRALWGVQVIAQPRYFGEAVLYAVIIASVSWAYLSPTLTEAPLPERWRRGAAIVAAFAVTQLLVIGLGTTLGALSRNLLANPSRVYVVGAINSLAQSEEPILNAIAPGDVLWPLIAPRNQLDFLFSPVVDASRFPATADTLTVLNSFGMVRPGVVIDDAAQRPDEPCPWILRDSSTAIPLPASLPEYWHTVRFTYLAGGSTVVKVGLGSGPPVSVPVAPGLNEAYAFLPGGGDTLTVTRVPDGVGVCLSEIEVGFTAEELP
jgi:hypothetical protein